MLASHEVNGRQSIFHQLDHACNSFLLKGNGKIYTYNCIKDDMVHWSQMNFFVKIQTRFATKFRNQTHLLYRAMWTPTTMEKGNHFYLASVYHSVVVYFLFIILSWRRLPGKHWREQHQREAFIHKDKSSYFYWTWLESFKGTSHIQTQHRHLLSQALSMWCWRSVAPR